MNFKFKQSAILICLLIMGATFAANSQATRPTSSSERLKSYQQRNSKADASLVAGLSLTNIGPTIMSGRVDDIEANPEEPREFYVAFASGGLWHTMNYGDSFEPLFDQEAVMTIGDIAVDWQNNILWVGTGESNSSRSSYAGNGMYKSTDGGKSWEHIGLDETHHIGRVILHPSNPDVVWVAALGHLYSANPERGVYKTTDGGKTWKKTLFVDDNTGAVDLVMDPANPDILYAAMWERERKAWNFKGSGKGSGIFKSTDGGEIWNRITTGQNGFPMDEGVGRIGLAISEQNSNKLFAILDNQNHRKPKGEKYAVDKKLLRSISREKFLSLSDKDINDYLDRNRFPAKYNAVDIKNKVRQDKLAPADLVVYLEDANALLFDTPVKGAEVYGSDDGGKTWHKTHDGYLDDLYYSYGYYFGNIRVAPYDDNKLYTFGVPFIKSDDGGVTWKSAGGRNQHGDHHALWVSKKIPGLLINGNDGGVNVSFDDGNTWAKKNTVPVGQFYSVNVDNEKSYNVYGGLQDNGVWYGPHTYSYSTQWQSRGKYPYQSIYGGDGMQVAVDTRDNNTIYSGFQFGNYARINRKTGKANRIKPIHELGERPFRFNWQSPIKLSPHNQDVVYFGSNKFHRSLDQGRTWDITSEDLTKGGRKGNVPYGTLTTIDESPIRFGLIYVGSDDGLVHVSKDGGYTWTDISAGLEPDQWVSRVTASSFKEGRVYVSLNGYRWDRFDAMVYVSEDYGKTWKRIGADLPKEPVNVIREDPVNEDLLYVGTDAGVYVSLDRGATFMLLDKTLPHVPVHDLVVQPKAADLVVGTHGRSIYRVNIANLQHLTQDVLAQGIHFFPLEKTTFSSRWGNIRFSKWFGYFEPETTIPVYVKSPGKGKITISTKDGLMLYEHEVTFSKGLNTVKYDFTINEDKAAAYRKSLKKEKDSKEKKKKKDNGKYYLRDGSYTLNISVNGSSKSTILKIKPEKKRPPRKPVKKIP